MFLVVLGILDIIAGGILAVSQYFDLTGNPWLFWLAVIFFLKGIYSVGTAAAAGFYFDLLGIADFIAALFLLMVSWNVQYYFFLYLGILVVLKGLYSMAMGLIGD